MQVDVASLGSHTGKDVDNFIEFFLRGNSSDTHEAVFPLGPRYLGKNPGNWWVQGRAADLMTLSDLLAGPVRVHQRQVLFHPRKRKFGDLHTKTVVSIDQKGEMVPAQIDIRTGIISPGEVDVLNTWATKVGFIVDGNEQIVVVLPLFGETEKETSFEQADRRRKTVEKRAQKWIRLVGGEIRWTQCRAVVAIDGKQVDRPPGEHGDRVLFLERFDHPRGDAVASARWLQGRLEQENLFLHEPGVVNAP